MPTFRASSNGQVGGAGQGLTCSIPAAVQAGDWGIVATIAGTGSNPSTAPSGWATLVADTIVGNARMAIYSRQYVAGDAAPVIGYPTAPTTGNNIGAIAAWYSGVVALNAGAVTSPGATASATTTAASMTVRSASHVVAVSGMRGSSTAWPTTIAWTPDAVTEATRIATSTFYPSMAIGGWNPSAGATNTQTGTWDMSTISAFGVQVELASTIANTVPTVTAGANQTGVEPWTTFTISATGADADGTIASYSCTQTGGTTVTLSGTGNTRTFTAPPTIAGTTLTFSWTVTDNGGATSSPATQTVAVLPATEFRRVGGAWAARRWLKRSGGAWV